MNLYNYVYSYFYPIDENKKLENKTVDKTVEHKMLEHKMLEHKMLEHKMLEQPIQINSLTQHELNFEKNIQKYNPQFKIKKPYITINQD